MSIGIKHHAINKQSGFTLVELVMVIVILGILAVTAIPKFVDLTSDAKAAQMKAVKGAIESAKSLVYSKSVIHGADKFHTLLQNDARNPTGVEIHWGYPKFTHAGIPVAAGLSSDDYELITSVPSAMVFQPKGSDVFDPTCHVQYGPDFGHGPSSYPLITIEVSGC